MSATPKDWSVQHWVYAKVVEIFGADLRSLATFRIVLALLVLADLANRATDLSAHYTDAGIMPRTVLVEQVLSPWAFSLQLMNGGSSSNGCCSALRRSRPWACSSATARA